MVLPIILMCLCALMMSYFLYEKVGKGYSLKAVFLKTIASMLFIALGAYCFYHSGAGHNFPPFAMVALALGMLGDIFLDMKYVFRDYDKEFTNAGFLVFGLGHIAYVTGMILEFFHEGDNVLYLIIPFALAILMGPMSLGLQKIFKLEYKEMKWIVFTYALMLFSTTFISFSLWMMHGFNNTALLLMFIGGFLFAASDLILNRTYFGEGHEKPFDLISNIVIYYVAQNCLAFSIFFL